MFYSGYYPPSPPYTLVIHYDVSEYIGHVSIKSKCPLQLEMRVLCFVLVWIVIHVARMTVTWVTTVSRVMKNAMYFRHLVVNIYFSTIEKEAELEIGRITANIYMI